MALIAKIVAPLGFVWAASQRELPWQLGWNVVFLDVLWWLPFGLILHYTYRRLVIEESDPVLAEAADDVLSFSMTQDGRSLGEMSESAPLLLVFLRHSGCTFCREVLTELGRQREEIEKRGVEIVLIHMSDEEKAEEFIPRYGLEGVALVSDIDRILYKAAGLKRGRLGQLFGLRVLAHGVKAGLKDGHGLGWVDGDCFQMPGTVLFHHGRKITAYCSRDASDKPDFVQFCSRHLKTVQA
jgi:peroxiredoxin